MSKAREIIGLDCEAKAAEGIKLLLRTRLEEMCGLRIAALDWSDIEGVHDMRVASRRLRSALRDFGPFLKPRKLRRVNNVIKQIADALGAVRDKDVAIAALEKLAAEAPPEAAAGIEEFAAERRASREDDRIALVEAVADERFLGLQEEFDASLEGALEISDKRRKKVADDQLEMSFRAAGQKIVEARVEELQALGVSLYQPYRARPIHRMRIAAKRLRYAIELFAQCWDAQLDSFAEDVAEMQTSLGELHDCDVWMAELGGLLKNQNVRKAAHEPGEAVDADEKKWHASVSLLSLFTKRRTNHYRDALARWHDWETNDFFARLAASMEVSSSDKIELFPAKESAAAAVVLSAQSHNAS